MANEIYTSIQLRVVNGNLNILKQLSPRITMNTNTHSCGSQVISTGTHEALSISGDVAAKGVCYIVNLDTTNYVQYGVDLSGTFIPFGKLYPGEVNLFRLDPAVTPYFLANTASVKVDYVVLSH